MRESKIEPREAHAAPLEKTESYGEVSHAEAASVPLISAARDGDSERLGVDYGN